MPQEGNRWPVTSDQARISRQPIGNGPKPLLPRQALSSRNAVQTWAP